MSAITTISASVTEPRTHSDTSSRRTKLFAPAQHQAWRDEYIPGNTSGIVTETKINRKERAMQFAENFDREAFRAEIRAKLLEMAKTAQQDKETPQVEPIADPSWVNDILYPENADEVAADVPEYWNAENTSQRIVDFAMSFRSLAPDVSDEEYIADIRTAIQEGFRLAKQDLGNLPGPVGKLFNDTYRAAMEKLDKILKESQQQKSQTAELTSV